MNDHDGIIPQIARNGVPGSPPRPTTHTHTHAPTAADGRRSGDGFHQPMPNRAGGGHGLRAK